MSNSSSSPAFKCQEPSTERHTGRPGEGEEGVLCSSYNLEENLDLARTILRNDYAILTVYCKLLFLSTLITAILDRSSIVPDLSYWDLNGCHYLPIIMHMTSGTSPARQVSQLLKGYCLTLWCLGQYVVTCC